MNITFLIGNGFDINIGLKTKYSDFYEYYKSLPKDDDSDVVKYFKENLKVNSENWSDLELALGDYMKNIQTLEDYDSLTEDIREKLGKYIELEEEKCNFDNIKNIYTDFVFPEKYLSRVNELIIENYKQDLRWLNTKCSINIITFNYSRALEKILKFDNESIKLHTHNYPHASSYLETIKHIHGYTDKRMVLGVNDLSQINNDILKNDINVLNAIIKPNCNDIIGDLIHQDCVQLLKQSDLICLFGMSIGDTDEIWWEIIGDEIIKRSCKLIIFWKGEEINPLHAHKIKRKEIEVTNHFLSKTNIKSEQDITGKIFVGYNTNIFNTKK